MHLSGKTRLGIVSLLLATFIGCAIPPTPSPPTPLLIVAASDLQTVMSDVIRPFEAENPGVEVVASFGSSGMLAEQIKAGMAFDVFLAANESFVKQLAAEKRIEAESVQPYAVGSLVMAVRSDAKAAIETLADIEKPEVKSIAIANPDVAPYGAAAKQALKKAGLWQKVEAKLVRADSVRQAFQFVQSGNADVAMVGRALTIGSDVCVVAVEPALHDPIVQALGVSATTRRRAKADAFARFVTGPKGQAILKAHGFGPPGAIVP